MGSWSYAGDRKVKECRKISGMRIRYGRQLPAIYKGGVVKFMNAIYANKVRISGISGIGGPRTRARYDPRKFAIWTPGALFDIDFILISCLIRTYLSDWIEGLCVVQIWVFRCSPGGKAYSALVLFAATFLRHVIYAGFMSSHSGMRHLSDWVTWPQVSEQINKPTKG